MYKKCENCYKDGKVPNEESCKKCEDDLKRKEQECEELLKENQQLRNSLSDSLMFKFTGQENETNRYRKALEEIEGIAKNFGSYAAWQEQRINKILDIINKAKGEE